MDNASHQVEEIEALESIYGNEWQKEIDSDASYSIQVSPDVKLFLTLSVSYPLEAPPVYQLLAPSLSKMVKQQIGRSFEELYLDHIGEPILFQWIEKLKEIISDSTSSEPTKPVQDLPTVNTEEEECKQFDITHGPVIQDRKSSFQAHVCKVSSEKDVRDVMNRLLENKKVAQATHNISAYKIEKSGGVYLQDHDDDGETHAGGRLSHLLDILNVKNVLVVVSRWYGGIQLGPDRFRHINNAARQALQTAGYIE